MVGIMQPDIVVGWKFGFMVLQVHKYHPYTI